MFCHKMAPKIIINISNNGFCSYDTSLIPVVDTCRREGYFRTEDCSFHQTEPVNPVWGNSRCLLGEPYGTHRYTVWAECRVLVC
jgi:hypothetical protein